MERRKLLLGSGAALATVLAGCSSTETDGSPSDNSPSDGSDPDSANGTDDEGAGDDGDENDPGHDHDHDENGDEKDKKKKGDGTDEEGDQDDEGDEDDGEDADEKDTIPGFDEDAFEFDSAFVSITDVTRDGDELFIHADTQTTDENELYDDLEPLADSFQAAVVDPQAFAAAINTVHLRIDHYGNTVATFRIEVDWIIAYLNGELTVDELIELILETV